MIKVMYLSFPTVSHPLIVASTVSRDTKYQPRINKTLLSFVFQMEMVHSSPEQDRPPCRRKTYFFNI